MLSIAMRSDWRYLVEHAEEGLARAQERDYYSIATDRGEPPGLWWGAGASELGLDGFVTERQMRVVYGALRHPGTDEQLGTAPRRFASCDERLARLVAAEPPGVIEPERMEELRLAVKESHREARTYADLTFSAPKSISLLHAGLEMAGRSEEADKVWSAMMTGVQAGLGYLQREAGYSRAGYHGGKVGGASTGQWIDGHDWTVALFRHHLSRDGDPQLHVHAAVLNRVRNSDGKYRSLDGQGLYRARAAAGAIAERVTEETLRRELGVEFETRPDGKAREVVGVPAELAELFSSRRRAITEGVGHLAAAYEERHGRKPSKYTLSLMAEHVTLSTRARKPDQMPTRAALLDKWNAKARRIERKGLGDVLKAVPKRRRETTEVAIDAEACIAAALEALSREGSTWTRSQLLAELNRQLPDSLGGRHPDMVTGLLDQLADAALQSPETLAVAAPAVAEVPRQLRRVDGDSIFEPHGTQRYTTATHLGREERLVALATVMAAPGVEEARVSARLAKVQLTPRQVTAVTRILGSSQRISVLIGPAGTGKSYTVGQMARIWEREVKGRVIGLAAAESAAEVLRGQDVKQAFNLHRFLAAHDRIGAGRASKEDLATYGLGRCPLVVVDEASMVATDDLLRAVELVAAAGGKVLLTGDTAQLSAVGAGGAMRLLAQRLGHEELAEVRRFAAEWEREASLQLREGDRQALLAYDTRGRFESGSADEMVQHALRGYLTDCRSGRRALLVVPTAEQAAELSSAVRAQRVAAGEVEEAGTALRNGNRAGVGDLIQARRNDWTLIDSQGRAVLNRDVYRVVARTGSGGLRVERQLGRDKGGREHWGPPLDLPPGYVAGDVDLAYASTVHAAQGRTVDTSHALVDEQLARDALYVALTRGIETNIGYVSVPDAETSALDVLASVVSRDAQARSATEQIADEFEASRSLSRLGAVWTQTLEQAAAAYNKTVLVRAIGQTPANAVLSDPALPRLWAAVRSAELMGHNASEVLRSAAQSRPLDGARSPAVVLSYRIEKQIDAAPFVKLETFRERTPEGHDPLLRFARSVAVAMDERVQALGQRVADAPPEWARSLGPLPPDGFERLEWIERAGVVAGYREQYAVSAVAGLGPVPQRGVDPDRWVHWRQASSALLAERSSDRLANERLQRDVEEYKQARRWAPAHISDQLRDAYLQARQERTTTGSSTDESKERIENLEQIASVRQRWYRETAEVRQKAQRASDELERRGQMSESHDQTDQRTDLTQREAIDHELRRARAAAALLDQRGWNLSRAASERGWTETVVRESQDARERGWSRDDEASLER